MTKFTSVSENKVNSMTLIRIFLALMVIVAHSYELGGFNDNLFIKNAGLGGLAVFGFFMISGYLVTKSYLRLNSPIRFLWNRFLRIYPGLWFCLLVTIFLVALPMYYFNNDTLKGFFTFPVNGPLNYFFPSALGFINQYNINFLLADVPYKYAFNGSLWSITYEIQMYILLAIFGGFILSKNRKFIVLALFVILLLLTFTFKISPSFYNSFYGIVKDVQFIPLTLFFLSGILVELYKDKIVLDVKYFIGAVLILFISWFFGWQSVSLPIVFPYLIIYLAYKLPFNKIDKFGDPSYGIYIYGFVVQQSFAYLGLYREGFITYTLASITVSIIMGYISFHLVEKRFLRMKNLNFPFWKRKNIK